MGGENVMTMPAFVHLAINQAPLLFQKLGEQLWMVGVSIFFASLVGIPLGICIRYLPKTRSPLLGTTNVFQTIPSLALLGILLPLLGIGLRPAIVALTLYALLPIVRNTYTGLQEIPAHLTQAAQSLGLTTFQRLRIVELPLAAPTIMAGVRTATSTTVGIATLAAFIGAGGLGDFINQGISLNNNQLILLGAIPAALLALLLDYISGTFEKRLMAYKNAHSKKSNVFIYLASITLFCYFGYMTFTFLAPSSQKNNTVVVASKNFTEQVILGELISQTLEKKTHLKVVRKFNLGTTNLVHQAMLNKAVDIYPEYTGTAYLNVLHQTYQSTQSANEIYQEVKKTYQDKYHLTWLAPFGFENINALVMPKP